jgi:hypothetical protein
MDECQWLGGGIEDVRDSSANRLDGEAMNGAQTDRNESIVGFSGAFNLSGDDDEHVVIEEDARLHFDSNITITFWVRPANSNDAQLVNKYDNRGTRYSGDDLGFKIHYKHEREQLRFILVTENDRYSLKLSVDADDWDDGEWHFVSARYDGSRIFLSFDDDNASKPANGATDNSDNNLLLAIKQNGRQDFNGRLDEVKFWNAALGDTELAAIRTNESSGRNYDGTTRPPVECRAGIAAGTWELIGIPADLRNESDTSVARLLGDDMSGSYGTDWRVYRRDYSDTNNSSWYTYLSANDPLEFGVGYWLGSKNDSTWDVNDLRSVDYDSSDPSCPASRCVEIPVKSVSLDAGAGDDLLGTGPYRYYMAGFVGKSPVDWADCRFIVDGTAYTPSEAETAGFVAKQIWQYNPDSANANSNGYTACDDVTPGSCKLLPYKGFWIELHGPSKGKSISLLIPPE